MKVWLVTIGEPVPVAEGSGDRLHRTGAFATYLAQRGHDVTWWTSTFDHFRKKHLFDDDHSLSIGEHLNIRLLHGCGYHSTVSWARYRDHVLIANKFAQCARRVQELPDIIVTALPTIELCQESVIFGRENDIPVVLDMRDMWPDIFLEVLPPALRMLGRVVILPLLSQAKVACRDATAIIGVTDAFVDWGVGRGARRRTSLDREFHFGYGGSKYSAEQISAADAQWDNRGIVASPDNFYVVFFGTIGRQFNLKPVIEAARQLEQRDKRVRFVLCGVGDRLDYFKSLAAGLSNVVFSGWVGGAEIVALMQRSIVGLAPYRDSLNFTMNLPNKPTEYFFGCLPVALSLNRGVLHDLLIDRDCGFSYADDPHKLADWICSLIADPAKARRLSKNARSLYEEQFVADNVYSGMAAYLQEVVAATHCRSRLDSTKTSDEISVLPQPTTDAQLVPSSTSGGGESRSQNVENVNVVRDGHRAMNVWLVTVGEPAPVSGESSDRLHRTGCFAHFLAERGHHVTWWTSTFNHSKKQHWFDNDTRLRPGKNLEIVMMHGPGYRSNTSPGRFFDHYQLGRKFRAMIRDEEKPDVIVAGLPTIELSKACADYGRRHGIPVVIDIRDLWPDIFVKVFPKVMWPAARIGLHPLFWATRQALRMCTSIVGVSDGYLDWGLRYASRSRGPNDAVFPLGYSPPIVSDLELAAAAADLKQEGVDRSKTILWFVGMFGRTYDLRTVIDAARLMKSRGLRDSQFVLSGNGDDYESLVERAKGLDNVVFTGWLGKPHLAQMLRIANVGLMAYAEGAPQGWPNKLFEYMSAGIPIVSSLKGETESLLNSCQCGQTYVAGDPQSLADVLAPIISSPQLREEMGRRGKIIFDKRFRAEEIYANMEDHLAKLVDQVVCVAK